MKDSIHDKEFWEFKLLSIAAVSLFVLIPLFYIIILQAIKTAGAVIAVIKEP